MSRRRILLQNASVPPFIPIFPSEEYLMLEYLHFSGKPKFDTGIQPYNSDLTPRGFVLDFSVDTSPNTTNTEFCWLHPAFNRSWYFYILIDKTDGHLKVYETNFNNFTVTANTRHQIIASRKNKTLTFDGVSTGFNTMNSTTTHGDGSINNISLGNVSVWGNSSDYKVYGFRVLDERDREVSWFQPAMRLSDHALGFWDYINEVFVTNTGSGTITYGFGDYEVLDYIKWDRNGVAFQTGVFYDNSEYVGWDLTFEFLSLSGRQDLLVCMGGSNYAGVQRGNSNVFKIQYSGNSYSPTVNTGIKYNYKVNPSTGLITIDGVSTATINPVRNYQSYFILGGWRQGNNTVIPSNNMTLKNCKVYNLKLYGSNSGVILNWIPMKKISTSEIGFYDNINDVFNTPQGNAGYLSYGTI